MKISVVRNLVHKLGGPKAVAVWCGSHITGDAVSVWSLRNNVPWRWRSRIREMADARNVRLNAAEREIISLDFALDGAAPVSGGSPTTSKGLRLAIEAAGSTRKLGKKLGISGQSVHEWKQVPADRIIAVEKVTGVPRERLRPDLYRIREDA